MTVINPLDKQEIEVLRAMVAALASETAAIELAAAKKLREHEDGRLLLFPWRHHQWKGDERRRASF